MPLEWAVRTVINKYAVFEGRAGRPEYWYWVLAVVLVSLAIRIGAQIIGSLMILSPIFSLAILVPQIAVGIRRLHDTGKSGWNVLWALIPILGGLYLLYLLIQPGEAGTNEYGPEPAAPPSIA